MQSTYIMGWDIGGAHIKAAVIQAPAKVLAVYQRPCQLWKGIDKLNEAAQALLAAVTLPVDNHVLTMTGELVDLFAGRDEGVNQILAAMVRLLPANKVSVFAGVEGILNFSQVSPGNYKHIASTNWLASATYTAERIRSGLFVDIGSTTTDILLLENNQVVMNGTTDFERLQTEELVYTGIVRTPVMAIAQTTQYEGREIGLMAEYFATMADVYRLTGELNEFHDQCETADGAEKSVSASAKRLARMIGLDFDELELPHWQAFALHLRGQQIKKIETACVKRLGCKPLPDNSTLVGAGVGRFLVEEIASKLDLQYLDFNALFTCAENQNLAYSAADCAAAVSIACLKGHVESPTA